jgi:hypothetical protein
VVAPAAIVTVADVIPNVYGRTPVCCRRSSGVGPLLPKFPRSGLLQHTRKHVLARAVDYGLNRERLSHFQPMLLHVYHNHPGGAAHLGKIGVQAANRAAPRMRMVSSSPTADSSWPLMTHSRRSANAASSRLRFCGGLAM